MHNKLITSMFLKFSIDEEITKRYVKSFTTELIRMGMIIVENNIQFNCSKLKNFT